MMKNRFQYLMILLGLLIVGCEPMEDIHDEIDAELENRLAVAEADYTLTEDDYDDLELGYPNFNNEDQARELIPVLLSDKYPTYGEGSQINVGFNLYSPLRIEDFSVSDEDYPGGLNYFEDKDDVTDFLDDMFDVAEEGSYKSVTYNVVAEEMPYTLTDDNYSDIAVALADTYSDAASNLGEYGNFNRQEGSDNYWTDAMIVDGINVVLGDEVDAMEGALYAVNYDFFDGSSGEGVIVVRFDGNEFSEFAGVPEGENYTLTADDYSLVATELADDYPAASGNLADFGNFNRQPSSSSFWSNSMLEDAFGVVVDSNYPDAEDGDVFILEYSFYDGSGGTGTYAIEKQGDDFVAATAISVVEETTVFAYTNNSWTEPFVIPSEAYTEEFGQRFSNFGDEEEALTTIATYLGLQFPYSQEGDFKAVSYQFYNGEATVTEYANFMYSNGAWMAIPDVISSTLQFGYEDGMWVPDNTINYLLGSADYSIIADALAGNADYATAVASMERYGNFDRRPGASAYWSDEMVLEAMVALLNEIAPNAEVGQKYVLTFDIYNGSNTTESIRLIKNEAGEWVINE